MLQYSESTKRLILPYHKLHGDSIVVVTKGIITKGSGFTIQSDPLLKVP
jgi:hypothetical protein